MPLDYIFGGGLGSRLRSKILSDVATSGMDYAARELSPSRLEDAAVHSIEGGVEKSKGLLAQEFNRALRDKRQLRPGSGRWVEYILPDLRRVYVESNTRRTYLGIMDRHNVTARCLIKPGGTVFTNDLHSMIMMGMVEVSGDMRDVVRTADVVGLQVGDPETRGLGGAPDTIRVGQKYASLGRTMINPLSFTKVAQDQNVSAERMDTNPPEWLKNMQPQKQKGYRPTVGERQFHQYSGQLKDPDWLKSPQVQQAAATKPAPRPTDMANPKLNKQDSSSAFVSQTETRKPPRPGRVGIE